MKKYSHRDVKNPSRKTLEKLNKVNEIISTGSKTIRRIFYMLASGSYESLGKLITWARLKGKIGWSSIVEEGRNLTGSPTYRDPEDFIDNVDKLYVKDKTSSFKSYFEVWLEKATLQGFFYEITDKYDVGLLVTRGQISWTALKKANDRLPPNSTIIYFGDNDDHGIRMYNDIKNFLAQLGCTPKFIRPALTTAQEKEFKFPKGEHHLDGMPEEEIKKLLEATIRKFIFIDKFNKLVKQEIKDKDRLRRMLK